MRSECLSILLTQMHGLQLNLHSKMGLIFRFEVWVGAAVLLENSSGCVANNRIFGLVDIIEGLSQRLQVLFCESHLNPHWVKGLGGAGGEKKKANMVVNMTAREREGPIGGRAKDFLFS